jgi:putative membrane protein
MSEEPVNKLQLSKWSRLSPLSVVYFIVHFTIKFIKDALINVMPILVIFITQVEHKLFWGSISILAILIALILYTFLYFINFQFKVTDDEIILHKGVLKKEHLTLNFSKVQNVNITTPFYFKPFYLVSCQFDAAGSAQQEVVLPGIVLKKGEVLRDTVFNYRHKNPPSDPQIINSSPLQDKISFLKVSNGNILKYGLMTPVAFLFLALLAPFSEAIIRYFEQHWIVSITNWLSAQGMREENVGVMALLFIITGVCLGVIFLSTLGALLRFYNYQLFIQKQKLSRIAGLFERHQMSVTLDKIQAIEVKQNWVALLLKRYVVVLKQIESSVNTGFNRAHSFLIPAVNKHQLIQLYDVFGDVFSLKTIPFKGISRHFLYKNIMFFCVLPSTLLFGFVYFYTNECYLFFWLFYVLMGTLLCWLRYIRYGIYSDGYFVYVKTGFIGYTVHTFSLYKLQHISIIQTPFMRKRGLASLSIQMAFGEKTIPYLPHSLVTTFINCGLYQAESVEKSWL